MNMGGNFAQAAALRLLKFFAGVWIVALILAFLLEPIKQEETK